MKSLNISIYLRNHVYFVLIQDPIHPDSIAYIVVNINLITFISLSQWKRQLNKLGRMANIPFAQVD